MKRSASEIKFIELFNNSKITNDELRQIFKIPTKYTFTKFYKSLGLTKRKSGRKKINFELGE